MFFGISDKKRPKMGLFLSLIPVFRIFAKIIKQLAI